MRFLALLALTALLVEGQPAGYQKPPKAILDVMNAPVTPTASLSPARTHLLLLEPVRNPSIADIAKPMLRLAGYRIDPATNGAHLTSYVTGLSVITLPTSQPKRVNVPAGAHLGMPRWSPDGKYIAIPNAAANRVELWIIETATAQARRVENLSLNEATGSAIDWLDDSRTLLVKAVPAGRGKPPANSSEAIAPIVQEGAGRAAPVRTNPDMLRNPADEALFDYYGMSQLAYVDAAAGTLSSAGAPALYLNVAPSPDGRFVLVTRLNKPYSYLHPAQAFPRDIVVLDRKGAEAYKIASLPLSDRVPIGGVNVGPRSVNWQPTQPATLLWAEALDGGNPKEKVPHRDRVLMHQLPGRSAPVEVAKTEDRFMGMQFGPGFAMYNEYERDARRIRTWYLDMAQPGAAPRQVFARNMQDRYRDPGQPLEKQNIVLTHQGKIFLQGSGASRTGDRPFLDVLSLDGFKTERLFQSAADRYETVVGLLADDGSKLLVRRESETEVPNYYIRTADGKLTAVTRFQDPAPQLRQIKVQRVEYKRPDGVPLSFTLYLPPDHKPGQRLPAVMWAYPLEYNDADTAGQITGSTHRFTMPAGASHLLLLMAGYAILDNASLPVIGTRETVNNTYLEQIAAGAKAAIDKADEMGVIDRNRVGVSGHSYGGFMTANLLAHTELFRAGVARSGAYNRTLTPFGFQSESRTFWEAQDVYLRMSPFMAAHKINEPILFIHGEADNNQGTFPIQSERMYAAVRGNGGTTRLVILPHESHGYSARESIEHCVYEMTAWFDRYVKNAPPRDGANTQ
jgi:dipeptidyl aminopeptidase/acylaminoacyl peptidase